jgi:hypothetical protein
MRLARPEDFCYRDDLVDTDLAAPYRVNYPTRTEAQK